MGKADDLLKSVGGMIAESASQRAGRDADRNDREHGRQ